MRAVRDAFPDPWIRLYSMKANGLPGLVRVIAAEDFAVSLVSGGELALGRRAGVAPGGMVLEGIGKSDADLAMAARLAADGTPLMWVSVESEEDAAALAAQVARLASGSGTESRLRVDAVVRVNPQVVPETLNALAVGAPSSKFGVLPEELPAVIEAGGGPNGPLRWRGIHLHVGSQLGAVDAWRSAFRVGLRLLELQRATLRDFDTLDAGGGFPVAYGDEGSVPALARFAAEADAELELIPAGARPSRLAVEPGRAVVAGSGWLIGRVLHARRREPPIVVLDTGMTELIRPALYAAVHPMVALTSLGRPFDPSHDDQATVTVRVDGPVCESTDVLGSASLPPLERGDIVAIGMAGAYGSSMFSTYNGRPRPPEVAWDDGRLRPLRRRGSVGSLP